MNEEISPPLMLGGIPVTRPTTDGMRLAMMIWGPLGCGKTTLAATAPGDKLYFMFDDGGAQSLSGREDIRLMDMSSSNPEVIMAEFRKSDPFTIGAFLKANENFQTLVVDSVTTLAHMALLEAVAKNRSSTVEQPGMHGYTWRNASILRMCTSLMQATKRLGRNIVFVTHEDRPDRDSEGRIISIPLALSEGTANHIGLRIGEVWWMSDRDNKRRIAIRPTQQRKTVKTRIFNASGDAEFEWHYDPATQVGEGIADWWERWQANGGKNIPLPSHVSTTSRGGVKK